MVTPSMVKFPFFFPVEKNKSGNTAEWIESQMPTWDEPQAFENKNDPYLQNSRSLEL